MRWIELSLDVPREEEEAFAALLNPIAGRRRHRGLHRRSLGAQRYLPLLLVTVKAYLPEDEEAPGKEEKLSGGLRRLAPAYLHALRRKVLEEEDWAEAWKAHYSPISVGRGLVIVPAWSAHAEDGRRTIILDPGMAFGTGQHPTTRMMLALMEQL
jgi:ribosomal protein L11 methyltransferase